MEGQAMAMGAGQREFWEGGAAGEKGAIRGGPGGGAAGAFQDVLVDLAGGEWDAPPPRAQPSRSRCGSVPGSPHVTSQPELTLCPFAYTP